MVPLGAAVGGVEATVAVRVILKKETAGFGATCRVAHLDAKRAAGRHAVGRKPRVGDGLSRADSESISWILLSALIH